MVDKVVLGETEDSNGNTQNSGVKGLNCATCSSLLRISQVLQIFVKKQIWRKLEIQFLITFIPSKNCSGVRRWEPPAENEDEDDGDDDDDVDHSLTHNDFPVFLIIGDFIGCSQLAEAAATHLGII